MVIILLFILGIIFLFPKSLNISPELEIRRPRTFVLGIIVIATAFFASVFSMMFDIHDSPGANLAGYIIPLLIPLVAIFFLKQRKIK